MNIVILSGFVGSDPKVYNHNGLKIAKVSIGTKGYRQKQEVLDWHNVEIFGDKADFVEKYMKKGDAIVVEGFLSTSSFTGKDGTQKSIYSVKVTTVEKPRITLVADEKPADNNSSYQSKVYEDDIPY